MLADRNPRTARRNCAVAAGAALGAFMLATIASAAFSTAASGAHSAVSTPPGLRPVSYGGYTFQVPGRWAVIDLAQHRRLGADDRAQHHFRRQPRSLRPRLRGALVPLHSGYDSLTG